MTLREFIKVNREEIDAFIRRDCGVNRMRIDNEERRLWILNDESLYLWARSAGVRI